MPEQETIERAKEDEREGNREGDEEDPEEDGDRAQEVRGGEARASRRLGKQVQLEAQLLQPVGPEGLCEQ